MEITQAMIEAYAKHHNIDLTDGSQVPGVIGTLNTWADGQGELDATLVDSAEYAELFAPLRTAYFAAHGVENPPLSRIDELTEGASASEGVSSVAPESAAVEQVQEDPKPEAQTAE